ncbi:MAG TPA: SpoIIE family protein phosphatase [Patescibacteria group bacterium]|nr:SpoIIE family protein phosphatase [Patescibacteria group bacterium]
MTILPNRSAAWDCRDVLSEVAPLPPTTILRDTPDSVSVLLVEDEPGDAHLIMHVLHEFTRPRFLVHHAESLAAAIAMVDGGAAIDVVLLDLSLPDSFGIGTYVRMQAAAPKLPIVIMTGTDDPAFAASAVEAGAQDYLVKSADPSATVGRVIRYAITRMNAQIERQALLERLADQQRRFVHEISIARAMQFHLLPRPERLEARLIRMGVEIEAFFEPSSGIGGDLWGCMDGGDNRLTFFTFDLSGHGIGAALNVFRLHTLLGEHWTPDHSPAETLTLLGGILHDLLDRGQFATMFLGILDCQRQELEWAAAGAPPPLLIEGGRMCFLDTQGVPLGLQKTPSYTNHRIAFPPGSSLFLYSDAITDAQIGCTGESFGEERLAAMAEAVVQNAGRMAVDHLLDRFYESLDGAVEDDLTALCITQLAL